MTDGEKATLDAYVAGEPHEVVAVSPTNRTPIELDWLVMPRSSVRTLCSG